MSERVNFDDAVAAYAQNAQQAYGNVTDEVFSEAYRSAFDRHVQVACLGEISAYVIGFAEDGPGEVGFGPHTYDSYVRWGHSLQASHDLGDGTTLDMELFTLTSLIYQPERRDFELERAIMVLNGDKVPAGEEVMGIKRTAHKTSDTDPAYPGLKKQVISTLISEADRLVVSLAAHAHLPEAPVEILAAHVDMQIGGKTTRYLESFAPTPDTIAASRRQIADTGVPASAQNVELYYDHAFRLLDGITHPEWVGRLAIPNPYRVDLADFRSQSHHAIKILGKISRGLPTTFQEIPEILQKHHAERLKK